MSTILDLLASSTILLLFTVVGIGFLLGTIRIFGFSLGPTAVLFTGLFFGALDPRLKIPELIYVLGLVLFVYTIGLQSGPVFFSSFGRRGVRANLLALSLILLAAGLSAAAWWLSSLRGPSVVGVFCGALTNTPALAAATEVIKETVRSTPEAQSAAYVNAPVIGYSVAYPFGVIGVLIGFYLFGKRFRAKAPAITEETESHRATTPGQIMSRTFRVTNPAVIGKSASQLMSEEGNQGIVLSRLRRGSITTLVYAETVFEPGDLVVAVGSESAVSRARELLGEESARDLQSDTQEFDFRRVEVSDKRVVGRTIGELNIQEMLDATITRIRRGDVDFVPSGDTILERGDRVRIITWAGNLQRVARFFGDSVRAGAETDFLSLSLGLVFGVVLGMIPLPLPGGSRFTLGFAGGPLIAGLVLGRLQRTGTIVWGMPFSVNVSLRQIGLVLFLAGIGTKAGDGLLTVMAAGGWQLFVAGAVITTVVTVAALTLGVRLLRLPFDAAMGLMSGIQTQPACLAYATEHSTTDAPNVWYATVYPAAMITKIILAQLLATLVLL